MTTPAVVDYVTFSIKASAKVAEIEAAIAYHEKRGGPLVSMRLDNAYSIFTVDLNQPKPAPQKFAKISRCVDGKPKLPDGQTLITTGRIFIEGEQVLCAAGRPQ